MEKIAIIGSGGFGREVHMLIEHINDKFNRWEFLGYFDDGVQKGTMINLFPVLGNVEDLNNWKEKINIVIAIGNPITKLKMYQSITNEFVIYPTLMHPNVIVGNHSNEIGYGCIICAGNIITVNTNIGNFVILNLACTVGHDTVIRDFCSFMPTVNISGEVIIEKLVYIGTGAKVINQLEIGERTVVGAGAVVFKSLPQNCTAVGVPAKILRFNDE